MALTLRLPEGWPTWSGVLSYWKTAIWVVLFALLSRLLYLPSSLELAGSDHATIAAPRNTSLVLEGLDRADSPAVTLAFDRFESFSLASPRAELAESSRATLAGLGATLPRAAGPHDLSWNVNLPPGDDGGAPAPGFLRVEIMPAPDADLSLGARDGNLRLASHARLELAPVAQDFSAIGGWLRLDRQPTSAPPDIMPQFMLVPGTAGEAAEASIAWRAADPELLLGDPFAVDHGLAVRSIAQVDEAGRVITRYCGAPSGGLLLSTLLQPRLEPQPPAEACRKGHLRVSTIAFRDGTIRAEVAGSAYVAGPSELLDKLRGNIVLWPVLAALIAIPGQKVLAAVLALFAKGKDAPPSRGEPGKARTGRRRRERPE